MIKNKLYDHKSVYLTYSSFYNPYYYNLQMENYEYQSSDEAIEEGEIPYQQYFYDVVFVV